MRRIHRRIFPLAVGTAVGLGLMVSMYTVWAGAHYTVIWMVLLGLSNTLVDLVLYPNMLLLPAKANLMESPERRFIPSRLQPRIADGR